MTKFKYWQDKSKKKTGFKNVKRRDLIKIENKKRWIEQ